jgi:alpha-L-fucosidase
MALSLTASGQEAAPAPAETPAQRDARMAWWRDARFGMFIHWGIYSVPAGTYHGRKIDGIGEWIMHNAKIPVAEYAEYAKRFNPVKFDAETWVKTAKDAGMKYIVITSKHHDGFAMFGSKASPYNIVDATPFQRDPLRELADACRKHDIKLGFYYSQAQDWHHPGGAAFGGHWDRAQDGDMTAYLEKVAVPQVREILTNYGPGVPAVLWWDTPADMTRQRAELLTPLLALRPDIITNNRLGGGFDGDTETPEQFVPATGFPGRDWETCMTTNDTWGYKSYDQNWKSPQELTRTLIDVASKGGNYLLNVGPTSEGEIPAASVERLRTVGRWMAANGEAIYGTSASPFKALAWGRCTQKPGRLYLHVFDWPNDGKLVVPMTGHVTRAHLLAGEGKLLPITASGESVTIAVPKEAPDAIASVVVAEVEGAVQPVYHEPVVSQPEQGPFRLTAAAAQVDGSTAKLESSGLNANIGYWTNADDCVHWNARFTRPSTFKVGIVQACPLDSAGSEYRVKVAGQTLSGRVSDTGGWQNYRTVDLGEVTVEAPGTYRVEVRPTKMPGLAVMNLRALELTPAGK